MCGTGPFGPVSVGLDVVRRAVPARDAVLARHEEQAVHAVQIVHVVQELGVIGLVRELEERAVGVQPARRARPAASVDAGVAFALGVQGAYVAGRWADDWQRVDAPYAADSYSARDCVERPVGRYSSELLDLVAWRRCSGRRLALDGHCFLVECCFRDGPPIA